MVAVTYRKLRKRYNLQEGDIIPSVRREIDVLRQIELAAGEDRSFGQAMHVIRGTPIGAKQPC